jgi:hypothetical protein
VKKLLVLSVIVLASGPVVAAPKPTIHVKSNQELMREAQAAKSRMGTPTGPQRNANQASQAGRINGSSLISNGLGSARGGCVITSGGANRC